MKHLTLDATRTSVSLLLAPLLVLLATQTEAFPRTGNEWEARYGAVSPAGGSAGCQLCHAEANGGSPWNGYGWEISEALGDPLCDLDASGSVTNAEAFFCVELQNSDGDGSGVDNVTEIGLGTQPGWTEGAFNTLFTRAGTITGQLPPGDIGPLDPDGTEPPPPPPPPPPGSQDDLPPGQLKRRTIVVKPGQSIQAALDRARPGTRILVQPGVYREFGDPTNGLSISKSGIRLIGMTKPARRGKRGKPGKGASRVILQNAGNQRNGIVVVPPEVTECMSCHESMAPPFKLRPGVEPGLPDPEPLLYDIEVRGITIQGFTNNGLFTERVDGFRIIDVESVDNKNYGIFPTLSKNGIVSHSRATGSDDSGIWVETSENVLVTHNLVEGNVNGFEVSNSDDILLAHNEARGNSVGMAILLLPDIFDDRGGAKRIDMRNNHVHDNNKVNTARPGSILASVPRGTGILHVGVDDSEISGNRIEGNDFTGVAIVDYCLAVLDTPFSCLIDPTVSPEFMADHTAEGNRIVGNLFVENGTNPDPEHPFAFAAADLTMVSFGGGNCAADNAFSTFFSLLSGGPPPCP